MRSGAGSRGRKVARMGVALGVVAVVGLAACGGSSSSSSKKSTSTTKAPAAAAVVKTANSAKGTILVDSQGKALYTLTNAGQAVPCTDACLGVWPPLMLPAGTTKATGGSGVTGLATVAANGGQQVTVKGLPLYYFMGDQGAGTTNGDGINSFGGVWNVVQASGGGGSSPSTTPATTSGGGSGY
jgi:predicted lipoprotein with Yx(FWY)xxD motif